MVIEDRLRVIVDKLGLLQDRSRVLYKNGMDLINFENDYHEVFDLMFSELFNEKQKELFDWWRSEGALGEATMWDREGNLICNSFESMYKLLKEYDV